MTASAFGQAPAAQPIFPMPEAQPQQTVDPVAGEVQNVQSPDNAPAQEPMPLPDAQTVAPPAEMAGPAPATNAIPEAAAIATNTPPATPPPTAPANVRTGKNLDGYRTIIERNPFNLKDAPAPSEVPKTPEPVKKPQEFYLTGISTVGYPRFPKMAYLMNKDPGKKEYAEKYLSMRLGDRSGDVVLNEIDEVGRRVKITLKNEQLWLSMKDNGVPAPAAAQPVVNPGGALPGATPGGGVYPNNPGVHNNPGIQNNPGVANVNPGVGGAIPNPAVNPSTKRNLRTGNMNYGGMGDQGGMQNPQPTVEPAQQYLNLIANQKLQERQGQPSPPIPNMMD